MPVLYSRRTAASLLLLLISHVSAAPPLPECGPDATASVGECSVADAGGILDDATFAGAAAAMADSGALDALEDDSLQAHIWLLQNFLHLRRDGLAPGSAQASPARQNAAALDTVVSKKDGPELKEPDGTEPIVPIRDDLPPQLSKVLADRILPVLNGDVPDRLLNDKMDPMAELGGTSLGKIRGLSSFNAESLTVISFTDNKELKMFASGSLTKPLLGMLSLQKTNVSNPALKARDVAVVMIISGTVNPSSHQLESVSGVEVQLDYVDVQTRCPDGEDYEQALCKVLGLERLRIEEDTIMKKLGETLSNATQEEIVKLLPLAVSTDRADRKPGTTEIKIINSEWSDGVVFCRGPVPGSMGQVYLDEELTMPAPGSNLDCSIPGSEVARRWGEGVPQGTTLAIGLLKGDSTSLYMPGDATWPSASCWFQDAVSNKRVSLAKGPRYQSQVEWTIQPNGIGNVWFDLSSVEGVSGGIRMSYTDADGHQESAQAIPGKPASLPIVEAPEIGFPVILAEKHVHGTCDCTTFSPSSSSCNTAACYAACPGPLVENACGQHRCRSWYAKRYEDEDSYCGWLFAEGAQTYCWAMDEWVCVDGSCGYGGSDQPKSDCSSPMPLHAPANTYSCGHFMHQPDGEGGKYWTRDVGCKDKKVNGVPTNPAPRRNGGLIEVEFSNLPWLHG